MNPSARAAGLPLPPHAARPSLFAAPGTSAASLADLADAQRILTSLLPQPLARRMPLRRWWAMGAGLTALALLAALYGVMRPASRTWPMRADAHARIATAAKPVASMSDRSAPDAQARVESPAPVARIESVTQSTANAADPFREMSRLPDAASPALVPSTPGAGKASRGEASTRTPIKAGKAVAAPGGSARRRADSDVDLLEAVVAHVSRPAAVGQGSAKPGRRDVVLHPPQPGESVGDLVQRCRAVGGLEGWLCSNRVCDGHWGSDAACPANRSAGPESLDLSH